MITCTVHERESENKDIAARADGIVFVREGFAWLALLFPVIWLLYHRMWLVLVCFLAIVFALSVPFAAAGLPEWLGTLLSFGLSLLLALEGNDLRRWSLARRGFQTVDVTAGRDREECERRFFDGWLMRQRAQGNAKTVAPAGPVPKQQASRDLPGSQAGDDVIGLFPEPGR